MKLLRFMLITAVLTFLVACGEPLNPQLACKELAKVTCERLLACNPDAKTILGDVDGCTEKLIERGSCDDADLCAKGTFHSQTAEACLQETKSLSCDAIKAGNFSDATSCSKMCTYDP